MDNYRVGWRIRVPEVRLIGADGSQIGIVATQEALRMAEEQGLDLVEVNPRSAPPVCKIMDFGKFKYEIAKKTKESRKHQSVVETKEIKLRPKTSSHDFDFKVRHIREFLMEGNKCRLVVAFRGREIVHPETGDAMLGRVVEAVKDIGMVEQRAAMEGRRMMMVVGPRVGVIKQQHPTTPGAAPAAEPPKPKTAPAAPAPKPAAAAAAAAPKPAKVN